MFGIFFVVLMIVMIINPFVATKGIANGIMYAVNGAPRAMNRDERRACGIFHPVWKNRHASRRIHHSHNNNNKQNAKLRMMFVSILLFPIMGTINVQKITTTGEIKEINKTSPVIDYLMIKYGPLPFFVQKEQLVADDTVNTIESVEADAYNGFDMNGYHYVPFAHGTNDAKESKMTYIIDKYWSEAIKFCSNGANLRAVKMTIAKFCAYMGLQMCPQKHLGFPLKPENIVITKSYVHNVKDRRCIIDGATNTVGKVKEEEFEINSTDGNAALHVPEEIIETWNSEEQKYYRSLGDFTLRGPWIKGHVDTTIDFHAYYRDNGVTEINGKPIEEIYMIIDETVFKAPEGAFENWRMYCVNFALANHYFGYILKEDEPKAKSLSYQAFQTLNENAKDITNIGYNEVAHLNNLVDNQHLLLNKDIGSLAKKFPSIMKEEYFRNRAERRYIREYREALGCRVHKYAYMGFLAPDPFVFLQNAAGMKIEEAIPANKVVWDCGKKTGAAIIMRFPITNAGAQCEVDVRSNYGAKFDKYVVHRGNVIHVSSKDNNANRMRADFDGDHGFLCFKKEFINAMKETHIEENCFFDWVSPKAEKGPLSREGISNYVANLCHRDELGMLNLALAKKRDYTKINHEEVAWSDWAINNAVDGGKHGKFKVVLPNWVEDAKRIPMPKYIAIAKDNKHPNEWGVYQEKGSPVYCNSASSTIAQIVEDYAIEKLPVPENEEPFDIRNIMFGSYGLKENGMLDIPAGWRNSAIGVSNFHRVGNTYDGWFQKWAMRLNDITVECRKTEEGRKSMKEMKNDLLEEFKSEFITLYRADWKHIYDVITCECFNHKYKYDYERDIMMNAWCFFFSATIVKYFVKEQVDPEEFVDDDDLNLDEYEIG